MLIQQRWRSHMVRVMGAVAAASAEEYSQLVSDLFTTPANLPDHTIAPINTPETAWTAQKGTWAIINVPANGSDQARSGSFDAQATVDAGVSDCVISAAVTASAGAGNCRNSPGIIVRWAGTSSLWRIVLLADGTFAIYEHLTSRASTDMGTPGVSMHLMVVTLSGQTITAKLDGGNEISYESASVNETATVHGILSGNNAHYVDNFNIWEDGADEPELIKLLAIGDSNTNGADSWFSLVTDAIHNYSDGSVPLALKANMAQAGAKVNDLGEGHMSDQVDDAAAENADIVLCLIGVNDCATLDQSIYTTNLNQLASEHANATIYAMGILDTTGACQADRDAVNVKIAAAAAAAGATYVDTDDWIVPATDTDDGLHLNAGGHTKVKNQVLSLLGYS